MFERILNEIADRDNAADGDYRKDGLLYCGKCQTPKQTVVKWMDGTERVVPVMCQCEKEAEARQAEKQRKLEIAMRIEALRRDGMTDPAYRARTFALDDGGNAKITELCRRYVSHWCEMRQAGQGLLFYGDVGTGKSFYACCIGNALIDKGVAALVTSFPRILSRLQAAFKDGQSGVIDRLQNYELLVLDDLGVERATSYALEQLYQVVEARLLSGLPLIVTTNLAPDDLRRPESMDYKRIYDRLKEMCLPVKVDGTSRRDRIAAERRKKCMEALGYEQPAEGKAG